MSFPPMQGGGQQPMPQMQGIPGLTPEDQMMLQQLFAQQGQGAQRSAELDGQDYAAQMLRGGMSSGGLRDTGRFKVAASPMEGLSGAAGNAVAGYAGMQNAKARGGIAASQQALNAKLFEAMMKNRQGGNGMAQLGPQSMPGAPGMSMDPAQYGVG